MIAMKNRIEQTEKQMNKLVDEIQKNENYTEQPHFPIELTVRFANDFSEGAVPNVIKGSRKIFHIAHKVSKPARV